MSFPPLDPELRKYVKHQPPFGVCIQHPLVQVLFYHEQMNHYINQSLAAKLKALKVAYDNQDWLQFVFLHERPWRAHAMASIIHKLRNDVPTYWKVARDVWIDSEVVHKNRKFWDLVFGFSQGREHLMYEDEARELDDLFSNHDKLLTVYRGAGKRNKLGLSWTVDLGKAEWFSTRFGQDGTVWETQVLRGDVLAYFTSRNESEILLPLSVVRRKKIYEHKR